MPEIALTCVSYTTPWDTTLMAVPAADVVHLRPGFVLLQHADHLLVAETLVFRWLLAGGGMVTGVE